MTAGAWTGWGFATVGLSSGSVLSGSIGSGQVGPNAIASGAVGSGKITSGAVQGSLGTVPNIASGPIGANDFGVAIASGNFGSGQIGRFFLASGAVNSGQVASGAVQGSLGGTLNIASGTIGPISLGPNAVFSGNIASGQVGRFKLADASVMSGAVASGAVLASLGGGLRNIASGTVGGNDFASGGVNSGDLGSGILSRFKLSSGTVNSGQVASGAVQGSLGATRSIGSGTIGPNDFGSGTVLSGTIASGQTGTNHFSSGAIDTYNRALVFNQYRTSETISGIRCAQLSPSGLLRIAMAAVSGRMPAIGVVITNVLSGSIATVIRYGDFLGVATVAGSGFCISGREGRSLWVGASGQVVTASGGGPTIGVGATNSGALGQRIGTSSASGAMLIDIVPGILLSGAAAITTNNIMWPV